MQDLAYAQLIDRLDRPAGPSAVVADCVLAAADGADALRAHIDDGDAPARRDTDTAPQPATPARAYLEEIAVTGFRGVAQRARLPLQAGPGLTLVVGRNGSGKSSFAEGLEMLLTGTNLRWDGRTKVWQEGWRNLHCEGSTKLEGRFRVDGEAQLLTVSRTWPAGAGLADGKQVVVTGPRATWDELGWTSALERHRPLLSYNELGAMFSTRAAALYEALSSVLGLEEFDALHRSLREVRLEREKTAKIEKAQRAELKETLDGVDDDRARSVLANLAARTPDLDAVGTQLVAARDDGDESTAALLASAALITPSNETIAATISLLEEAIGRVQGLESTEAERLDALAAALETAVSYHERHGDMASLTCPVCGTPEALDIGWVMRTQAEIQQLRSRSAGLREARDAVGVARRGVEGLFPLATPVVLQRVLAAGVAIDDAQSAWETWAQLVRGDDASMTDGAAVIGAVLVETLAEVRSRAITELERRDSAWRPLRDAVVVWLDVARKAARDKQAVAMLKSAEQWMTELLAALRRERLAPVVEAAQANWALLRHESNVALGAVELRKSGQQRYASFDVTVDGTESSAFGVMSQGELSALAVSIFVPRASLPDSPFGFMVIDDPVQSMDPAKVDGLARVMARAAATHQVVVLTHDERLPEAVRRLDIDARVIRVHRRARSRVEVVAGAPPSDRYIGEAIAMAKTEGLPAEVRARVVPGFCRSAIEAACAARLRRRLLVSGNPHAQVEEELEAITSLNGWLCAAFELRQAQGHELTQRVRSLGGEDAVRAVTLAKKGAHTLLQEDSLLLIEGAKRLVRALERP